LIYLNKRELQSLLIVVIEQVELGNMSLLAKRERRSLSIVLIEKVEMGNMSLLAKRERLPSKWDPSWEQYSHTPFTF
jgi:hypothetical protein